MTRRPPGRLGCAAALVLALNTALTAADESSRAARIAASQAEKARALRPYTPTKSERLAQRIEKALTSFPRVYVWFGSVYRGGWIAAGPGFRQPFLRTGLFDAHGAISLRNYKLVDTSLRLPSFADGRVQVTGEGTFIDAPHVRFYGIGNESPPPGRDEFLYRSTAGGARATARVGGPLSAGGYVGYLQVDSDASNRQPFGSGAALFDSKPSWIKSSVFAQVDWRPSPSYARRGGYWRATWSNFAQQVGTGSAFREFDAEAAQLVPLLRENWILALHARVTTTDTDAGNEVPFYLMPSIGGGSSLRGYHSWRFRDRNAFVMNAEYRWTPSHYLDMALFVDAGKVAPRASDLDFNDLRTGYGIGARFHTSSTMVLRIDLGHSTEGTALHWAVSHGF